jgi:hypothetical protein
MAVHGYEPLLRLAISDDPSFPADEESAQAAATPNGEPLPIQEWQTYYVKVYGDPAPASLALLRFVGKQIQPDLWELNFRNFVGLSRIGGLRLEIHNRKISKQLYHTMLDELATRYASLVFSFGSPVGQHYSKAGVGQDSAFVEYLFLCKYLLHDRPNLDAIATILVSDPHRKFERALRPCAIDECHTPGIDTVQALLNSPMATLRQGHPLQQTRLGRILQARTGRITYPSRAVREIKHLTVDTHENRFIKFFLEGLQAKVETLSAALAAGTGSYFNPDIDDNLRELRQMISQCLAHNMWREVGVMRFIPVSSQVLQRKEGYRQLFRLYSLLQLATQCDFLETDFKNLAEIKDVPTIYEYWCFFQVKAVMDTISQARTVSRMVNENPKEHTLSSGLRVEYACGAQLLFNASYGGSAGIDSPATALSARRGESYSHTLRPDIVIVSHGRKLIFDAKYKGKQRSGLYCEDEDGTIQGWRDEDIDKMHTYRDAIQGVIGSYILYPGTRDIIYPRQAGGSCIDGVGALSLRPGLERGKRPADTANLRAIIETFLLLGRDQEEGG